VAGSRVSNAALCRAHVTCEHQQQAAARDETSDIFRARRPGFNKALFLYCWTAAFGQVGRQESEVFTVFSDHLMMETEEEAETLGRSVSLCFSKVLLVEVPLRLTSASHFEKLY
jgi:hypothetical protein